MELQLERPLVVFDLETTGTNVRYDRIVEIAAVKTHPDGRTERFATRLNPERSIPACVTAIHGIRDEDVKDCPTFADIAPQLLRFFDGCDFAGFGIVRFDIPVLSEEFRRAGFEFVTRGANLLDAQIIFHKREPRNLTAALRFYCGEDLVGAHGAEADAVAALKVLEGQVRRYSDLPRTADELGRYCNPGGADALDPANRLKWNDDEVVLAFGEYAGRSLREMATEYPQYLQWVLRKQFPKEVKEIVRNALNGKFPRRGQSPPPTEKV